MKPLRLAVCDDQPEDREALISLLKQSPVQTACVPFAGGEALLAAFRPGAFDLLLIDIYMEGITGVETARMIRQRDGEVPMAFITSSTEYALEGYRLSALKYLEKPVRQRDLDDLLRMAQLRRDAAPRLTVSPGGARREIALSDLLCLEQRAHHVVLFLKDGVTLRVYAKLSDLLPQLEAHAFFRTHKSYCVNLRFVRSLNAEYGCFVMADGQNVPISRPHRSAAKKAYEDFLFAQARRDEG